MRVVFFQRKQPVAFFSLEELFDNVRRGQSSDIFCIVKSLRFQSSGLFKRLYGCIECFFCQGDVNHITGDIHFIAPFLSKKKTVLTIHDLGFMASHNKISRSIYLFFWIKLPIKSVAIVTTVSEATKNELIKFSNIDPSKIRVIHNPVNPLFKRYSKYFNKEMPTILQVGVTPNKNIARLAAAIKGIRCRLLVLGKLSSEDHKLLNHLKICFTEFFKISTHEVIGLYNSCDIVSFVSTVEGFGLPIIEANAVGRVVVTSNISSMPEVASNAAHLVDPFVIESIRDGVIKVIEDDHYRNQLIMNGFDNVKRFDLNKIANEYNRLYFELYSKEDGI